VLDHEVYFFTNTTIKVTQPPIINIGARQNRSEFKNTPKLYAPPQDMYIKAYPNGMQEIESIIFKVLLIHTIIF
jgi:hypothetical protein